MMEGFFPDPVDDDDGSDCSEVSALTDPFAVHPLPLPRQPSVSPDICAAVALGDDDELVLAGFQPPIEPEDYDDLSVDRGWEDNSDDDLL